MTNTIAGVGDSVRLDDHIPRLKQLLVSKKKLNKRHSIHEKELSCPQLHARRHVAYGLRIGLTALLFSPFLLIGIHDQFDNPLIAVNS